MSDGLDSRFDDVDEYGQNNNGKNNISKQTINALKGKHAIELPIDAYEREILDSIANNDEVVLQAKTGAGKSTRTPQMLANAGYNVIVTQPRVLAALSLADRVAEEMGTTIGDAVGYHVGRSAVRNNENFTENTKIKFCTDGLQLVKQLMGQSIEQADESTVLMIDEVHERNQNIEVLVARVKKLKQQGKKIKIIISSATLNAEGLAKYFADDIEKGENVLPPIIDVPGRTYPVERSQDTAHSLLSNIVDLVKQRRNILVFQPGKKEIHNTISDLQDQIGNDAVILPLHGELTPEEQKKIYKQYSKPVVIVSTNIAQTSVTIPYIDAVVDTGLERRIEIKDGVETLVLGNISQADSKQRGGRAGRTKPGIYVLCSDTPFHHSVEYPQPEIQRTLLDHNYLRILSSTGLKMEDLDFYHQPPRESIASAKNTLHVLGAIDDHDSVTKLGHQLAKLPVDVNAGRMIVEASQYSYHVFDTILKVAAIKQAGSIVERNTTIDSLYVDKSSDLLTQVNLMNRGWEIIRSERNYKIRNEKLKEAGIFHKSLFKAIENYKNLKQITKKMRRGNHEDIENEHDVLLKCIAAGMLDTVFTYDGYGNYKNNADDYRQIDRNSYVDSDDLVVGEPRNIQFSIKGRKRQKDIVGNITTIKKERLKELAPHLISYEKRPDIRNDDKQSVVHNEIQKFDGLAIDQKVRLSDLSEESIQVFCYALATRKIESDILGKIYEHNKDINQQLYVLYQRTGHDYRMSDQQLADYYRELLHSKGIHKTTELEKYLSIHGPDIFYLNDIHILIPEYDHIMRQYPYAINVDNKDYLVSYEISYTHKINIKISSDDAIALTDDMFQGYFEGKPFGFIISTIDGDIIHVDSLATYKDKVEEQRLQEKWDDFLQTHNKTAQEKVSFARWDGMRDIQTKLYDAATESYAYLGVVPVHDEYAYEQYWFKNENDAQKSLQQTKEKHAAYIAAQEKEKEIREAQYACKKEYEIFASKARKQSGWEHTQYQEEIRTALSNMRDRVHDQNPTTSSIMSFTIHKNDFEYYFANAVEYLMEFDKLHQQYKEWSIDKMDQMLRDRITDQIKILDAYFAKKSGYVDEEDYFHEFEWGWDDITYTISPCMDDVTTTIEKYNKETDRPIQDSDNLASMFASKFGEGNVKQQSGNKKTRRRRRN